MHKQSKYYIVHFKELFALDGKQTNLSENDIARRNTIAKLLSDWGLVNIKGTTDVTAPLSQIKIISFKEKDDWTLETKYNIGKKEKHKEKIMACIGHQMLDALRAKYEAQYKEAEVTLKVYANNPVAIGEHPQHIEEMDKLVSAMADAQDNLDIINKVYDDKQMLVD